MASGHHLDENAAVHEAGQARDLRTLATWAFVPLLLAGCALRFSRLAGVGLWYDELWTVVGASEAPDLAALYREWLLGDPHPPGFTLAYRLWFQVFPNDEFWARLPSAVAGVLNVAVLLRASRVFSLHERVLAASFVALSHGAVLYALTCKQYSPMLLLETVLLVTTLEVLTTRHATRRALWTGGLSALGLVWLDAFGTVFAALCFAALLVALWRAPLRRDLGRVAALVTLGSLPVLAFHAVLLRYSPGDWQQDSWAALAADALPHLFFPAGWVGPATAALAVTGALSLALDPAARQSLRSPRNAWLLAAAGAMLAFLVALGAFKPVAFIRYFLVAFPPVLVLLGVLAAAAFPPSWRVVFPLAFFLGAAASEGAFLRGFDRQHWNRSVDLVLGAMGSDDVVCVLGAPQDRTMFEYLQAGDEWGLYYVRNRSFYRYYFRRRGANDLAERLEVVQPWPASADALVAKYAGSGRRVWVLGGHHLKYADEVFATLQRGAKRAEMTQLFSTRVYELQF